MELDVEGGGVCPAVGTRHVPGGGEVAEVALKGWVVVGQGIELAFYPLAMAQGDGVCLFLGVLDVHEEGVGIVAEAEALPVQWVLAEGVPCSIRMCGWCFLSIGKG